MTRQYLVVEFTPGAKRSYTYHNDGREMFVGDRVKCPGPDGWSAATVLSTFTERPDFETKAILGSVEDAPDPLEPRAPRSYGGVTEQDLPF